MTCHGAATVTSAIEEFKSSADEVEGGGAADVCISEPAVASSPPTEVEPVPVVEIEDVESEIQLPDLTSIEGGSESRSSGPADVEIIMIDEIAEAVGKSPVPSEGRKLSASLEMQFEMVEHTNDQSRLDYQAEVAALRAETDFMKEELAKGETTIRILIEEKNDLTASLHQSRDLATKLELDLASEKKQVPEFERTIANLQKKLQEEVSKSKELLYVKDELTARNRALEDTGQAVEELKMRNCDQASQLLHKDNLIKELRSQLDVVSVNMQQVGHNPVISKMAVLVSDS